MPRKLKLNTPRRPTKAPLGLRRVKVPKVPIAKKKFPTTAKGVVER